MVSSGMTIDDKLKAQDALTVPAPPPPQEGCWHCLKGEALYPGGLCADCQREEDEALAASEEWAADGEFGCDWWGKCLAGRPG